MENGRQLIEDQMIELSCMGGITLPERQEQPQPQAPPIPRPADLSNPRSYSVPNAGSAVMNDTQFRREYSLSYIQYQTALAESEKQKYNADIKKSDLEIVTAQEKTKQLELWLKYNSNENARRQSACASIPQPQTINEAVNQAHQKVDGLFDHMRQDEMDQYLA